MAINLMEYIELTRKASSEEDVAVLLQLMNPHTDKDVMGEIFTQTIGWDPTTHYDIEQTIESFDIIVKELPAEVSKYLDHEVRQKIIDKIVYLEHGNILKNCVIAEISNFIERMLKNDDITEEIFEESFDILEEYQWEDPEIEELERYSITVEE